MIKIHPKILIKKAESRKHEAESYLIFKNNKGHCLWR